MVWFRVDDDFHDHRKVRAAGPEAIGLWMLAGSWCAGQPTEGFVPADVLPRWDRNWRKHAARLVDVGLWLITVHDNEGGFRFHDWLDYQPSAAQIEADRLHNKQRQRKARDKARAARLSQRDDSTSNAVTNAVTDTVTTPVSNGPPVPVPVKELKTMSDAKASDAVRPEVYRLCERLAGRIEANGSKRPEIGETWLTECRRLIDLDGKTPEQIEKAIDWCQDDAFWRANILSMPKLRAKYDQLALAAKRSAVAPVSRYDHTPEHLRFGPQIMSLNVPGVAS